MLTVQLAGLQDAEAVSALVNSAYRGETSKLGWTTEADLLDGQRTDPESLRLEIANPATAILLFQREDQLVGSVLLQKRADPDFAYLGMFTVAPHLQTGGIGKAALELIEKWVVENWKVFRIEITVIHRRQELLAWYERRGFVRTGRTHPFPHHDPRAGIPKVKDLDMLVLEKRLC